MKISTENLSNIWRKSSKTLLLLPIEVNFHMGLTAWYLFDPNVRVTKKLDVELLAIGYDFQ